MTIDRCEECGMNQNALNNLHTLIRKLGSDLGVEKALHEATKFNSNSEKQWLQSKVQRQKVIIKELSEKLEKTKNETKTL